MDNHAKQDRKTEVQTQLQTLNDRLDTLNNRFNLLIKALTCLDTKLKILAKNTTGMVFKKQPITQQKQAPVLNSEVPVIPITDDD